MAREARAAYDAGASIVHVHFRQQGPGKGHLPSWEPALAVEIAQAIRAARKGGPKADKAAHFPTLDDGIDGAADRAVRTHGPLDLGLAAALPLAAAPALRADPLPADASVEGLGAGWPQA